MTVSISHRQIDAFRCVMQSGSITIASKYLNVTQPAVSRLIRELEDTTGLSLFRRIGNKILPTEVAKQLYSEVEQSYIGIDKILKTALRLREPSVDILRIASQQLHMSFQIPRFLMDFRKYISNYQIILEPHSSQNIVELMRGGLFDLGIVAAPVNTPDMNIAYSVPKEMVAVMPKGSPLEEKEVLSPLDFEGHDFISLGPLSQARIKVDKVFAEFGIRRQICAQVPSHHTVCAMVANKIGISIVERYAADDFIPLGISIRKFLPSVTSSFCIMTPMARASSSAAQLFTARFLEYADKAYPDF